MEWVDGFRGWTDWNVSRIGSIGSVGGVRLVGRISEVGGARVSDTPVSSRLRAMEAIQSANGDSAGAMRI